MFKVIICMVLLAFISCSNEDLCPDTHLQTCETDLQKALQKCQKAAKEKGKDQQADQDCVKYFITMRKQCWPCICKYAEQAGIKVKGCQTIMKNLRTMSVLSKIINL